MNKYVLDNNIFSRSLVSHQPFDVFNFIWQSYDKLIKQGQLFSVSEVFCELEKRWNIKDSDEWTWILSIKDCFLKPTNNDCEIVKEIFKYPKFRECVKEKSLRTGSPEADAFLIAKAKNIDGIVVTAEKDVPNSSKIPCIAAKFNVPYIKERDFLRILKNIHEDIHEIKDVPIYYELQNPTYQEI